MRRHVGHERLQSLSDSNSYLFWPQASADASVQRLMSLSPRSLDFCLRVFLSNKKCRTKRPHEHDFLVIADKLNYVSVCSKDVLKEAFGKNSLA